MSNPIAYIDDKGAIVVIGLEAYRRVQFINDHGRAIPDSWTPLAPLDRDDPSTRVVDREFRYATTGDDGSLRSLGGCVQHLQDKRLDP